MYLQMITVMRIKRRYLMNYWNILLIFGPLRNIITITENIIYYGWVVLIRKIRVLTFNNY